MSVALAEKKRKLEAVISRESRAAVACSGGVDSTLLLRVVLDVLGHENTIAVFAETPLLPHGEAEAARDIIKHVGSRLLTVRLNPLVWPDFIENPQQRCYLCKRKIYQTFLEKLAELHFNILLDGTNLDDTKEMRPGLKALHELNVKTPLLEAGLTKKEIRGLGRNLQLPNWNKYTSSCLATRIGTGEQITEAKLELVNQCENFLRDLHFEGCRVRITNDSAVIELLEDDIKRFAESGTTGFILEKFNDFNIKNVFLSLRGRQGICF